MLMTSLLLTLRSASTSGPCSRRICLPYSSKRFFPLRRRLNGFTGRNLISLRSGMGM